MTMVHADAFWEQTAREQKQNMNLSIIPSKNKITKNSKLLHLANEGVVRGVWILF